MAGYLKPDKGDIFWNGVSGDKVDRKSLYARIGFIMQESILFNLTIRENLPFVLDVEMRAYHEGLWSVEEGLTTVQTIKLCPATYEKNGIDIISLNKAMLREGAYIVGIYNEYYIKGKKYLIDITITMIT